MGTESMMSHKAPFNKGERYADQINSISQAPKEIAEREEKGNHLQLREQLSELELELELCREEKALLELDLMDKRRGSLLTRPTDERYDKQAPLESLVQDLRAARAETASLRATLDAQSCSEQIVFELNHRNECLVTKVSNLEAQIKDLESFIELQGEYEQKQAEVVHNMELDLHKLEQRVQMYEEKFEELKSLPDWERKVALAQKEANQQSKRADELAKQLFNAKNLLSQLQQRLQLQAANRATLKLEQVRIVEERLRSDCLRNLCSPDSLKRLRPLTSLFQCLYKLQTAQDFLEQLYYHESETSKSVRPPRITGYGTPAKAVEDYSIKVGKGLLAVDLTTLHEVLVLQLLLSRGLKALSDVESVFFEASFEDVPPRLLNALESLNSKLNDFLDLFQRSSNPLDSVVEDHLKLASELSDFCSLVSSQNGSSFKCGHGNMLYINTQTAWFRSGIPKLFNMLFTAWKRLGDYMGRALGPLTVDAQPIVTELDAVFVAFQRFPCISELSIKRGDKLSANFRNEELLIDEQLGARLSQLLEEANAQCSLIYKLFVAWSSFSEKHGDGSVFGGRDFESNCGELFKLTTSLVANHIGGNVPVVSVQQTWADFRRHIDVFALNFSDYLISGTLSVQHNLKLSEVGGILVTKGLLERRPELNSDSSVTRARLEELQLTLQDRDILVANQAATIAALGHKVSELSCLEQERDRLSLTLERLHCQFREAMESKSNLESRYQKLELHLKNSNFDVRQQEMSPAKDNGNVPHKSKLQLEALRKALVQLDSENQCLKAELSVHCVERDFNRIRLEQSSFDGRVQMALKELQPSAKSIGNLCNDSRMSTQGSTERGHNEPRARDLDKITRNSLYEKLGKASFVDLARSIVDRSTLSWTPFAHHPFHQFKRECNFSDFIL